MLLTWHTPSVKSRKSFEPSKLISTPYQKAQRTHRLNALLYLSSPRTSSKQTADGEAHATSPKRPILFLGYFPQSKRYGQLAHQRLSSGLIDHGSTLRWCFIVEKRSPVAQQVGFCKALPCSFFDLCLQPCWSSLLYSAQPDARLLLVSVMCKRKL